MGHSYGAVASLCAAAEPLGFAAVIADGAFISLRDEICPPENARLMFEAALSPEKRLLVVPEAEHDAKYQTAPQLYESTVIRFLEDAFRRAAIGTKQNTRISLSDSITMGAGAIRACLGRRLIQRTEGKTDADRMAAFASRIPVTF
jgi:hypothetical protein